MASRERPLKRSIPKRKDETPICAFDFETEGLGGPFIIAAFLASDGSRFSTLSLRDAFQYICEHPQYRYLAHNASGYEFAYLYSHIYMAFQHDEAITIIPTLQGEDRIVQFRINKNGKKWLDLRDSMAIFNASLENVSNTWCPEIPKGEPPWNEAHDNFDPNSDEWMQYLWRDCEIIVVAYQKARDLIWETFHTNLGVTAGRTAMNAFQTEIGEDNVYWRNPKRKEEFFRHAYYGGVVFPGHQLGDWGDTTSLDINGAYAYQMEHNWFPTSTPAYTHIFHEGKRGIYRVVATVPEWLYQSLGFNPVPLRTKNGLLWPSGQFETYLTDIEISYATTKGCSFEVIDGYVWYETTDVFGTFIRKCQQLELDGEGRYKPMVKLLRNALYGKFGTKEEHNTILFSHDGFPEKPCIPLINETTGEWIDGVYLGKEEVSANFIHPEWASFITSYQRIYLFSFMEKTYAAGATTVYCDTDSIKCSAYVINDLIINNSIPIGNKYGQFKVEETVKEFIVLGPKTYYGKEDNGQEHKKAKGMPKRTLSRSTYTDRLEGKSRELQFDAVTNLLTLVKHPELSLAIRRKRTITDITNSAAWEFRDNKIYPRKV